MLDQLLEAVDVVVIASPPVPEVAEVVELAVAVDVTVIAARLRHTRRDKLIQLREMLLRRGVSPVGFVLTTRESSYQDQGDYYDHPTRTGPPDEEVPAAYAQGHDSGAAQGRPTPVRTLTSPPTLGSAPAEDVGRGVTRTASAEAHRPRAEDDSAA
jgi:Mrp family chromosome partitioning ATPase